MLKYCKHSVTPYTTLQYCIKVTIMHYDILEIILQNISVLTKIEERLRDITHFSLAEFCTT